MISPAVRTTAGMARRPAGRNSPPWGRPARPVQLARRALRAPQGRLVQRATPVIPVQPARPAQLDLQARKATRGPPVQLERPVLLARPVPKAIRAIPVRRAPLALQVRPE